MNTWQQNLITLTDTPKTQLGKVRRLLGRGTNLLFKALNAGSRYNSNN